MDNEYSLDDIGVSREDFDNYGNPKPTGKCENCGCSLEYCQSRIAAGYKGCCNKCCHS